MNIHRDEFEGNIHQCSLNLRRIIALRGEYQGLQDNGLKPLKTRTQLFMCIHVSKELSSQASKALYLVPGAVNKVMLMLGSLSRDHLGSRLFER